MLKGPVATLLDIPCFRESTDIQGAAKHLAREMATRRQIAFDGW